MTVKYRYFNVPQPTDTPDVVRDIKAFADSQWNTTHGVFAQINGQAVINAGQGSVSIVSVNHTYPAGTLLALFGRTAIGTYGSQISYYDIRSNGGIVSPQYQIAGNPGPASGFAVDSLIISTGPATISLQMQCDMGSIAVDWRYINVQGLQRG